VATTVTKVESESKISATLTLGGVGVATRTVMADVLNPTKVTYTSTSTPAGTVHYAGTLTIPSSGTAATTLDLTALTDAEGNTYSTAGLTLQEIRFQAASDNSGDITVQEGDSDPYYLGSTGTVLVMPPGTLAHLRLGDTGQWIGTYSGAQATDIKIPVRPAIR